MADHLSLGMAEVARRLAHAEAERDALRAALEALIAEADHFKFVVLKPQIYTDRCTQHRAHRYLAALEAAGWVLHAHGVVARQGSGMAVDLNHRAVRSTVGSHAVDLEAERDCFEAQFPRPSQCEWIPQSAVFCATAYHAWDADKHIARWEGWKAGALARAMTPDRRPLTCPRCGATNANDAGELSASDDARRLDRLEQAYTDGARDPQTWREFMTRVAEVGFRAAIDGVGTGGEAQPKGGA